MSRLLDEKNRKFYTEQLKQKNLEKQREREEQEAKIKQNNIKKLLQHKQNIRKQLAKQKAKMVNKAIINTKKDNIVKKDEEKDNKNITISSSNHIQSESNKMNNNQIEDPINIDNSDEKKQSVYISNNQLIIEDNKIPQAANIDNSQINRTSTFIPNNQENLESVTKSQTFNISNYTTQPPIVQESPANTYLPSMVNPQNVQFPKFPPPDYTIPQNQNPNQLRSLVDQTIKQQILQLQQKVNRMKPLPGPLSLPPPPQLINPQKQEISNNPYPYQILIPHQQHISNPPIPQQHISNPPLSQQHISNPPISQQQISKPPPPQQHISNPQIPPPPRLIIPHNQEISNNSNDVTKHVYKKIKLDNTYKDNDKINFKNIEKNDLKDSSNNNTTNKDNNGSDETFKRITRFKEESDDESGPKEEEEEIYQEEDSLTKMEKMFEEMKKKDDDMYIAPTEERDSSKHHIGHFMPPEEEEKMNDKHFRNKALKADNKGFKMLKKMGWSEGNGLGSTQKGISEPIKVSLRENRAGLGSEGKNDGDIFTDYQKRMATAYKYRPNPLNNPRKKYY